MRGSGHKLNQNEADMINSILNNEEMNLDNFQNSSANISFLDDQCRQIWPNWDTFAPNERNSQHIPSYSPNVQKGNERRSTSVRRNFEEQPSQRTSYSNERSPRYQSENSPRVSQKYSDSYENYEKEEPQNFRSQQKFQSTPRETKMKQQQYERSPSFEPRTNDFGMPPKSDKQSSKAALETFDIQSMKSDIDSLYARINSLSSRSPSSSAGLSPPKREMPMNAPTQQKRESSFRPNYTNESSPYQNQPQNPVRFADFDDSMQEERPTKYSNFASRKQEVDAPRYSAFESRRKDDQLYNFESRRQTEQQPKFSKRDNAMQNEMPSRFSNVDNVPKSSSPYSFQNRRSPARSNDFDLDDTVTQSIVIDDNASNEISGSESFMRRSEPIRTNYAKASNSPKQVPETNATDFKPKRTTFDFSPQRNTSMSASGLNSSLNMSTDENEELVKLRTENFMMRSELMKAKKKIQITEIENKRLEDALEKSAKLIERYKRQLQQFQQK